MLQYRVEKCISQFSGTVHRRISCHQPFSLQTLNSILDMVLAESGSIGAAATAVVPLTIVVTLCPCSVTVFVETAEPVLDSTSSFCTGICSSILYRFIARLHAAKAWVTPADDVTAVPSMLRTRMPVHRPSLSPCEPVATLRLR